jgi:hypothetical protein
MRKTTRIFGSVLLLTITLTGCKETPGKHPRKHTHYSQIYEDAQGRQYARTYDSGNNDFLFWMMINNNNAAADTSSSSGSWQRIQSISSSGLTATSRAVVTENGKPTEQEVDAEEVSAEEMTDEESSPSEAQAEAAADTADAAGEGSSGGDAGGSSGGDSGGDGGE